MTLCLSCIPAPQILEHLMIKEILLDMNSMHAVRGWWIVVVSAYISIKMVGESIDSIRRILKRRRC